MERTGVHCIFQWRPANSQSVTQACWEFESLIEGELDRLQRKYLVRVVLTCKQQQ